MKLLSIIIARFDVEHEGPYHKDYQSPRIVMFVQISKRGIYNDYRLFYTAANQFYGRLSLLATMSKSYSDYTYLCDVIVACRTKLSWEGDDPRSVLSNQEWYPAADTEEEFFKNLPRNVKKEYQSAYDFYKNLVRSLDDLSDVDKNRLTPLPSDLNAYKREMGLSKECVIELECGEEESDDDGKRRRKTKKIIVNFNNKQPTNNDQQEDGNKTKSTKRKKKDDKVQRKNKSKKTKIK
jgi:hypothetical protein